ncbi:MAG: hypothetical protein M1469_09335 [Bacteroidetes bacterium]|nr:hypothetical protein [Bacteroidota bacterium]
MRIIIPILALLIISGCEKSNNHMTDTSTKPPTLSKDEALSIMNEVLDDFEFIHQSMLSGASLHKAAPTRSQPIVMSVPTMSERDPDKVGKVAADSIFVYGDTATINGVLHCVVVTEKHAYPKGLLLITKSSKYAPSNTRGIASVTDRYISWNQFSAGTPEQRTESIIQPQFSSGTDSTIEAHVSRTKGSVTLSETFRFTSPAVTIDVSKGTRVVRSADPLAGQIVSATYDQATGVLLSKRATGQATPPPYGGFYTQSYTFTNGELASWVKTTTLGQADHSVVKTIERYP